MSLIVKKFGGTSVGDLNRIKRAASIIANSVNQNNQVVVVVSAMSGITKKLVSHCNHVSSLNNNNKNSHFDYVTSSGEIVSAGLVALCLEELGIRSRPLQGWQVPIISNNNYGNSFVEHIDTTLINNLLSQNIIPVITGFQAVTSSNYVATLGRGGSDITAALVAAALQANSCDIYTDVAGIYEVDPRIIHHAQRILEISANAMLELSESGAQVVHSRAILAVMRYGIKMRVLSSFTETGSTLIFNDELKYSMEKQEIKAITHDNNLIKVAMHIKNNNECRKILSRLKEYEISINRLNIADHFMSFFSQIESYKKCDMLFTDLLNHNMIHDYTINSHISLITIIGYAFNSQLHWDIINLLYDHKIDIYFTEFSLTNIKILVDESQYLTALKVIHELSKSPA